ncbi:MAG: dephospho-CoA kinase [Candidatus Krumholzibacteriota bacterium]|nr:dephospho-CoA kinase [Candidatus Krumholzibacteriota bacterium]
MDTPVVVVTGPIASGKSTVARIIADNGGVLLDADKIANLLLEDRKVRERVLREFGKKVTDDSGLISREKLGRIVFSDREKLELLNRILYPYLKRRVEEEILSVDGSVKYIVLDAVLFFQYKFDFEEKLVVVTRAPENVRKARLAARDGIDKEEAEKRVRSQRPIYKDWEKGDIVIDTDCSIEEVKDYALKLRADFIDKSVK